MNNLSKHIIITNANNTKKYINWIELKKINEDIIGWIEIENTNINYPILKDNNLYYLNHSYDKHYNKNGSIFTLDSNPFISNETVIYGHNMKNKTMFSQLSNYTNQDFFSNNNKIKIYTPSCSYEGTVFSAYSININSENDNVNQLSFDEKLTYYKKASKCTANNIDKISKIVKLSTCSYINSTSVPTDQRYYIIASIVLAD